MRVPRISSWPGSRSEGSWPGRRSERTSVADLKLAVTEACTNAIEHAYSGDQGDNEVVVRFALDDDTLSVEVQDWGSGFDAEAEPCRTTSFATTRASG